MLLKLIISFFFICFFATTVVAKEDLPLEFSEAGITEKLGSQAEAAVTLRDHNGEPLLFSSLLGTKPLLINFAYYTCPRLCHLVVNGLVDAVRGLDPDLLDQLTIVTLSFDNRDNADTTSQFRARYKEALEKELGRELDWHFLYGEETEVRKLASSVGYGYKYNPKSKQYAHASTLLFLSPEGAVTRYLYGIQFKPFDIKLSLIESKKNKSISTVDSMLLFCYNYNPDERGYVLEAFNLMKIAGIITVIFIVLVIIRLGFRTKV